MPFACRIVRRDEALASAEARDPLRTRADDAIVEVEVVAAFLQHEAAGIVLVAAPVAHEEGAVVGLDVLGGLDRDDLAELSRGLGGAQGRGTSANSAARGRPSAARDRYFAIRCASSMLCSIVVTIGFSQKTFRPASSPMTDMIEMHVVRRADHQQVELFAGDQLLGRGIGLAGRDALFDQAGQARRLRIDIARDLEAVINRFENIAQIAQTESEPDDPHSHTGIVPTT